MRAPKPNEINQALERVLASEAFVNSPRLQDFLTFIVKEELQGRGSAIRGKIIATDVYDKELDENGGALNLVRVEARRLRRGLEDYYSGAGKSDTARIIMQTGGYRPIFERITSVAPNVHSGQAELKSRHGSAWNFLALLVPLVLLLIIGLVYSNLRRSSEDTEFTSLRSPAELAALRQKSVTSVQAINLAEQARGMFFPLLDVRRQAINLESFRHVITLDPNLSAGYAGAAQVLTLQSVLINDADMSAKLLSEALVMAERAIEMNPTDGWSQASYGWTLAVSGDLAGGLKHTRIAFELEPNDGHILDLVGITALLANEPSLMAEVSHPERNRTGNGRFAHNNIYGTSQLMLQNYDKVIDAFSTAAERGHPVSAPSLFLLATALQESGNTTEAEKTIREMWETWPEFPVREVASRFFANDPVTRNRVFSVLDAYTPR